MSCLKMSCFTCCHTIKHRKTQKPIKKPTLRDLIQKENDLLLEIKLCAELIKTVEDSKDENQGECKTQKATECLVKNEKKKEEKKEENNDSFSDSLTSSSGFISLPINDRYYDCKKSGSESEDITSKESDLDNCFVEEESSESLFSISLSSAKQDSEAEMDDKEVNSPLKPRERDIKPKQLSHIDSALNPIQNLSQLRSVKAIQNEGKEIISLDQENIIPFRAEHNFKHIIRKQVCDQCKAKEKEVTVDTSFLSWLVESGKALDMKMKKNSSDFVCNSSKNTMSSKVVQERLVLRDNHSSI